MYLERSLVSVALRSPWVSAPRLSSLLATTLANLCSPDNLEMRKMYSGAFTWFDLRVLPEGRGRRRGKMVKIISFSVPFNG